MLVCLFGMCVCMFHNLHAHTYARLFKKHEHAPGFFNCSPVFPPRSLNREIRELKVLSAKTDSPEEPDAVDREGEEGRWVLLES